MSYIVTHLDRFIVLFFRGREIRIGQCAILELVGIETMNRLSCNVRNQLTLNDSAISPHFNASFFGHNRPTTKKSD